MNCPKCGKGNTGDSANCSFCNAPFKDINTYNKPLTVSVSKLAILAIVLSFCCMFLIVPFIIAIKNPRMINPRAVWVSQVSFISQIFLVISIILGFISFIRIEKSGGLITGRNFAIAGILLPIFIGLLPILYAMANAPRSIAFRMVCGTNLSGIGKAMLIYANDYNDELPLAGGKNSIWGRQVNYDASTRYKAYGLDSDTTGGKITISSSLYLLVKYAELTPKSFICNKDKAVTKFDLSGFWKRDIDYSKYWDFGSEPWKHCSYAYHMPYSSYSLTTSSEPGMAVAADRNPWLPSVGWNVKDFSKFNTVGGKSITKNGNTPCHQDEGQNVLFLDSHVDFTSVSFCGVNEDNIYTSWDGNDIKKGKQPVFGSEPESRKDSLLLNDFPIQSP